MIRSRGTIEDSGLGTRASAPGAVGWGLLLWFVLALLTLPLFAHGCHGDDVDHEPLFFPFRLNDRNQESVTHSASDRF